MKSRHLFLFCMLPLLVPGLACAQSAGTPNWGVMPHQPSRPHLPGPGPHSRACNPAGVWKVDAAHYNRAWGKKRLVERHNSFVGPQTKFKEYTVQEYGVRQAKEIAYYDVAKRRIDIYTFLAPDHFIYESGSLSADCRQMTLEERGPFSAGATRLQMNRVGR